MGAGKVSLVPARSTLTMSQETPRCDVGITTPQAQVAVGYEGLWCITCAADWNHIYDSTPTESGLWYVLLACMQPLLLTVFALGGVAAGHTNFSEY